MSTFMPKQTTVLAGFGIVKPEYALAKRKPYARQLNGFAT